MQNIEKKGCIRKLRCNPQTKNLSLGVPNSFKKLISDSEYFFVTVEKGEPLKIVYSEVNNSSPAVPVLTDTQQGSVITPKKCKT